MFVFVRHPPFITALCSLLRKRIGEMEQFRLREKDYTHNLLWERIKGKIQYRNVPGGDLTLCCQANGNLRLQENIYHWK